MQITVNEPGARTIRDSRPMQVDGQNVYVVIGGGTASLMMGGRIVAEQAATEMTAKAAQDWAVKVRDERAADLDTAWGEWIEDTHVDPIELLDELVADEEAVAEAVDPAAVYAGAVEQVRAGAVELLAKAEAAEAHGDAPYRFRNSRGRMVTFHTSDPRHPVRAAVSYRRDAERLAAWTWQDEQAYGRYVSDGIGATDGYFAPIDRAAWKATLGA
jgi:hypothetical protein